ncbi:MAG TPA: hypothetical protein VF484_02475, partial [Candidatus Limnocylindrales bacterium]
AEAPGFGADDDAGEDAAGALAGGFDSSAKGAVGFGASAWQAASAKPSAALAARRCRGRRRRCGRSMA